MKSAFLLCALLALSACSGQRDVKIPGLVNEATTATGTGNTAGQSAAAGASVNSEGAKERAREAAD